MEIYLAWIILRTSRLKFVEIRPWGHHKWLYPKGHRFICHRTRRSVAYQYPVTVTLKFMAL